MTKVEVVVMFMVMVMRLHDQTTLSSQISLSDLCCKVRPWILLAWRGFMLFFFFFVFAQVWKIGFIFVFVIVWQWVWSSLSSNSNVWFNLVLFFILWPFDFNFGHFNTWFFIRSVIWFFKVQSCACLVLIFIHLFLIWVFNLYELLEVKVWLQLFFTFFHHLSYQLLSIWLIKAF